MGSLDTSPTEPGLLGAEPPEAPESPDSTSVNSAGPSEVPLPPQGGRSRTLLALLVVGLLSFSVAFVLWPSARFALIDSPPLELGDLRSADLASAGPYVRGSGQPSTQALSFRRRGADGAFRLTQLEGRADLWLVLRVPKGMDARASALDYIPPSTFQGRLVPIEGAGLTHKPVVDLILARAPHQQGAAQQSKPEGAGYLLYEGESPSSHQSNLFAFVLLALLFAGCFSFAGRLFLSFQNRSV